MADKYRFKRHDSIGAAAAEEDHKFLTECFIDNGDLSVLLDCKNTKRVIVGRTGSGKTALIQQLLKRNNVIEILPESLSFNFLSNSGVLRFFLDAGVKLDLFFKLLWRHVFTVELLKRKYHITNENAKKTYLESLKSIFNKDKNKEKAIEYLLKWGGKFFEETEYRIKEITNKLEDELKGSMDLKRTPIEFGISSASKLTEEQKIDVVQRGQSVINNIQMKELGEILSFLDEDVFDDQQEHFYICIDRLDENWIDDRFRYLLIRSLIETVKDFYKVKNVKIFVALRTDLLERVFRLTRDPGFQEEKYRSFYLQLNWQNSMLSELLDKRVNLLIRSQYTQSGVTAKDILPSKIDGDPSLNYMIRRTLMRPRELIEFFNTCIEYGHGKATFTKEIILRSEGEYSKNRLRSLQDEWISDYPSLIDFTSIIRKQNRNFKVRMLDEEAIEAFALNYATVNSDKTDFLSTNARGFAEANINLENFLAGVFQVFYKTGIVGIKTESYDSVQWSHNGVITIAAQNIDFNTTISIHPTFHRVLGIKS